LITNYIFGIKFYNAGKANLSNCPQIYVPDAEKNEEYWAKRVKNNVAARRSREARRLKENQVNKSLPVT
jgi:G:T-mismatch repair DNA endonuclease (very short patch repair protein)